jgi:hypothetical protein
MPFDMPDGQLQTANLRLRICAKNEKGLKCKIHLWDEHFKTQIFDAGRSHLISGSSHDLRRRTYRNVHRARDVPDRHSFHGFTESDGTGITIALKAGRNSARQQATGEMP